MLDLTSYEHVDEFGDDDEYEDEEVVYLTLDLGTVHPTLLSSSSSYKLIGLETETPFLQLSGTIFKGQHNSLLGTELLFTEDDRNKKSLSFIASTKSRICFKEVQLVPKGTAEVTTKPKSRRTESVDPSTILGEGTSEAMSTDRMTGKNPPATRARRSTRHPESVDPEQPAPKRRKQKKEPEDDDDDDD